MKYKEYKQELSDLLEEYTYRAEQLLDIQKTFDKFSDRVEKLEEAESYVAKSYENKSIRKKYDYLMEVLSKIEND